MHSPDNSPVIEGLTPSQLIRSPRRIATLAHHSVTGVVKRHREVPAAPVVPPRRGEQAEIVIGDRFGRDSVLLRLVGDPSKALLFAVNDGDQLTVGGTGFVVAAPDATSPDWRITLGHFNSDCFMEVTLASSDVVLQYDSKSGKCVPKDVSSLARSRLANGLQQQQQQQQRPASIHTSSSVSNIHPAAGLAPPSPLSPSLAATFSSKKGGTGYVYNKLTEIEGLLSTRVPPVVANFYGVVSSLSPPEEINQLDKFKSWFRLVDPSVGPYSEIMILCFGKSPEHLPRVTQVGQVVRCHRMNVEKFNGKLQVKAKHGAVVVFDGHGESFVGRTHRDPRSDTLMNYTTEDSDRTTITDLRKWVAANSIGVQPPVYHPPTESDRQAQQRHVQAPVPPAPPQPLAAGRPVLTLQNMTADVRFCDYISEVIHAESKSNGFELMCVDYTVRTLPPGVVAASAEANCKVVSDGDQFAFNLRCWEDFGLQAASAIQVGDIVHFKNVALRDGTSVRGVIEGSMRVGPLTSFEVYDPTNDAHKVAFGPFLAVRQRERPDEPYVPRNQRAPASLSLSLTLPMAAPVPPPLPPQPHHVDNAPSEGPLSKRARTGLNAPSVASIGNNNNNKFVSSHLIYNQIKNTSKTTLKEIIQCADPATFVTEVAVVGYNPGDIRDFSRLYCAACDICLLPLSEAVCPRCSSTNLSYKWSFALRIADATAEVSAIAFNVDAQQLLMGQQAVNLREHKTDLEILAKRLKQLFDPNYEPLAGSSPTGFHYKFAFETEQWNEGRAPGSRAPHLTIALRTYAITNKFGHPERRFQFVNTAFVYSS